MRVAVVVHAGKTFGGGLDELRTLLYRDMVMERREIWLRWYEVEKSREAPAKVGEALKEQPELMLVWGGDGMVQRCLDAVVGADVTVGILPAGTANLLALNLGIPVELPVAYDIAMNGATRHIDLGRLNGEHFAVMAGMGFDADMIKSANGSLKGRLGKLAYVWTGLRAVRAEATRTTIKLDGEVWFDGDATCVLVGNVAKVLGGVEVFDAAAPDDGWLDIGVSTAQGAFAWSRALLHVGIGRGDASPYIKRGRARKMTVQLASPLRYELDGGARKTVKKVKVRVVPGAVAVRVPHEP
jgi:YegS/Rv2252/BmrU family lipid kinase